MQKKYFITYGTNEFNVQKRNLLHLAKKSGEFTYCIGFNRNDIDNDFYNKYKTILDGEVGGGYYLYKLNMVQKVMKNMKENDILVYSDAGSSLNLRGINRLREYFELLNADKNGNLRFQMELKEKYFTVKEIFNYFNLSTDSEIGNSGILVGGHFLLKKNKNSVNMFKEFENIVNFDKNLITNYYDEKGQIEGFKRNSWDQSITSILSKVYGGIILKDETYFQDNEEAQFSYPFLAVRKRSYPNWNKFKFYILYPLNRNKTTYFGGKKHWYQKPSYYKRLIYKFSK